MFGVISITMFFVSVIEAVSMECCLQPRCRIDEKERIIDEMFLTEFGKEHLGNRLISRRGELHMWQAVRLGIDSGVQPEPFVIELDHGLVDRNVIRVGTICGL
jgi:hypothetical protein